MKLELLNSEWALYSESEAKLEFDSFRALDSLLSIRSCKQLVTFLETEAANRTFALGDSEAPRADYDPYYRWRNSGDSFYLFSQFDISDNFEAIIAKSTSYDFLDALNPALGERRGYYQRCRASGTRLTKHYKRHVCTCDAGKRS